MVNSTPNISYVPILRWRGGEKSALKAVEARYRNKMIPLIELVNDEGDTPDMLTEDIKKYWPDTGTAYVDVSNRPKSSALYALDNLAHHPTGVDLIPVIRLDTPPIYYRSIQDVALAHNNGVAVRVIVNDESEFDIISKQIDLLLSSLSANREKADLIVDFGYVSPLLKYDKSVKELVKFVSLDNWRRVIIAGGVFPDSLLDFDPDADNFLPRWEWTFWNNAKPLFGRDTIFADYTCRHPVYHDKFPSSPSVSLRYTLSDKYQIFRGSKQDASFKYLVHSMNAVSLYGDEYPASFSGGDEFIHNQAADLQQVLEDGYEPKDYPDFKPGNPQNWVTATVSHHMAVVLKDNLGA